MLGASGIVPSSKGGAGRGGAGRGGAGRGGAGRGGAGRGGQLSYEGLSWERRPKKKRVENCMQLRDKLVLLWVLYDLLLRGRDYDSTTRVPKYCRAAVLVCREPTVQPCLHAAPRC
jgi:hypothetical protein